MGHIPKLFHPSWHPHVAGLFDDENLIELNTKILPANPFYPPKENIFSVFQMPLDKIKVVILGKEPYPHFAQANGLAFGVNAHVKRTPAIDNIERELSRSEGINRTITHPTQDPRQWKTLIHWFHQGVFLLNTALTVEATEPGSHASYWRGFSENIISIIASQNSPVWLLWGQEANSYRKVIEESEVFLVNDILEGFHPNGDAFIGCNHFLKANEILLAKGQTAINW